jgi:hypothetical protein
LKVVLRISKFLYIAVIGYFPSLIRSCIVDT